MEQFAVSLYNSFDVTQAVGPALDALVQLNGLSRLGGTYTKTQVVVTTTQAVTLNGINQTANNPFTVSDSNGNLYYLLSSISLTFAQSATLNFQASMMGFIQVVQNTITVIQTPQQGVITVNNPVAPYNVGADQETDAQLRARQQQSTAGISTHKAQSLYAALSQIPGIEQAVVYENNTNATNSLGVPAHSIWTIVNGGTSSEIGNTIYDYISDGVGMKGSATFNITQVDGSNFVVYYDVAAQVPLYVTINIESLNSTYVDNAAIATYLSENYVLGINEIADITSITALVKAQYPTVLVTACAVSKDNSSFVNSVQPGAVNDFFVLQSSNITITNS
jgi:hypothetical protein